MLFQAAEHEPLADLAWDDSRARAAIWEIGAETDQACLKAGHWPQHPLDADWSPGVPMLSLFWGASSVAWAMLFLKEKDLIPEPSRDYQLVIAQTAHAYSLKPDTSEAAPGFLMGDGGILALQYRFTGAPEIADKLHQRLRATLLRPENELMWAAPGAILCANWMLKWTSDERWREVIRDGAEVLFSRWKLDDSIGCRIWTQDLYGKTGQYLGAVHGFAGNVRALLEVLPELRDDEREFVLRESAWTLAALASFEKGMANWPPLVGHEREDYMVQWCHGAPGILTSFAYFPPHHNDELEGLLLQAGELVWKAGPLKKPFGLCHGTAGNAYALLSLARRTGDNLWLKRARSFAMHALAQSERERSLHGRRRYSTLTGDLGLALCLWSCIDENPRFPLIDIV